MRCLKALKNCVNYQFFHLNQKVQSRGTLSLNVKFDLFCVHEIINTYFIVNAGSSKLKKKLKKFDLKKTKLFIKKNVLN